MLPRYFFVHHSSDEHGGKMKKVLSFVLVALLLSGAVFAGGGSDSSDEILVGVSMPTKSLQRWNQDGSNMEAALIAAGYEVDLQYADNKVDVQVSQIENMVTKGADILVVAAIDGGALSAVLDEAKSIGCDVIAYDRLIMNTDAVSYYATFDNYSVGTIQGEYVEEQLGLKEGNGPFNVEFTTGDPSDNNIVYFFGGAMDVLKPYIDNGQLIVRSGQTERAQVATPRWATEEAQKRFENILTAYYSDGETLDAAVCSNDSTAQGVVSALKAAGYSAGNMPYITGQDCDVTSVKAIIAGEQSMSIFKDTRALADKVVEMVDAIAQGGTPDINNTTDYDNGVKVVPSYLLTPVFADINNYEELLIDTGYYTMDQLN